MNSGSAMPTTTVVLSYWKENYGKVAIALPAYSPQEAHLLNLCPDIPPYPPQRLRPLLGDSCVFVWQTDYPRSGPAGNRDGKAVVNFHF